jgi:hypothetical protein
LIPAFLVFCALVSAYNYWYLRKTEKYNSWVVVRIVLLLAGLFGIFLSIPSLGWRGAFLILSVAIIAAAQILIANFSENILINETLIAAAGLFLGILGATLYIPPFSAFYLNLLYMALVFSSSSLLARSFYEFLPHPAFVKLAGSLIIGFFTTQSFWALGFLPFHFSATAIILLNFFYFCLILNYYYLFHILNAKKIIFHFGLMAIADFVVLIFTPWNILD